MDNQIQSNMEYYNGNNEDVLQINLREAIFLVSSNLIYIILAAIIGATIAYGYVKLSIPATYSSTATVYMASSNGRGVSLLDSQAGYETKGDVEIIAKTRNVLEDIIDSLGLKVGIDALRPHLILNQPEDTHMIKLTATWDDSQVAADIANQWSISVSDALTDIMEIDEPTTIEEAEVSAYSDSSNVKLYTLGGAGVGMLLVIAFVFIKYLLNDTLLVDEDVEKHLGLPTLGSIPYDEEKDRDNRAEKKNEKRSKRESIKRKKKKENV